MSTKGITFGKVVAGAGIAVGAVMLCSAAGISLGGITEGLGDFFKGIGEKLSGMFSGNFELGDGGKALVGAGVIGGSYALMNAMNAREEDLRDAQIDAPQPVDGGFAEKIAMDRAMMRCRAAMVSQSPQFCAGAGRA